MYYLNDKHSEYEYIIYCKKAKGTPYLMATVFNNEMQIKSFIIEIGERHQRFNQPYYIDNNFYENIHPLTTDVFYYKILKRKVNNWQTVA